VQGRVREFLINSAIRGVGLAFVGYLAWSYLSPNSMQNRLQALKVNPPAECGQYKRQLFAIEMLVAKCGADLEECERQGITVDEIAATGANVQTMYRGCLRSHLKKQDTSQ